MLASALGAFRFKRLALDKAVPKAYPGSHSWLTTPNW